uniref:Uncharacterized protein n=1 Tax=Arundo donax TaxID=35708 RepID=A0A0A9FSK4_ARUDO
MKSGTAFPSSLPLWLLPPYRFMGLSGTEFEEKHRKDQASRAKLLTGLHKSSVV